MLLIVDFLHHTVCKSSRKIHNYYFTGHTSSGVTREVEGGGIAPGDTIQGVTPERN